MECENLKLMPISLRIALLGSDVEKRRAQHWGGELEYERPKPPV